MPITLDGSNGITTPTYGGADTAEYFVPVTQFKNRIINGAMVIDQRNAGASVTATDGGYQIDRYQTFTETADGVFTVQRVADAPAGFINSAKITVTTADASIGATQRYLFIQNIEGFNVADLGFGSAAAKTVTVSFWVKSSVTGSFGGCLSNAGFTRTYPFSYSISSANTWEYKTVTVAGDTTGTWTTDNGVGLRLMFGIGVGSSNSGTANTWAGAGYYQPTGAVNLISTLNATLNLTGVQLEVGSTATSFDYRPYGTELALCQRYCFRMSTTSAYGPYGMGHGVNTTVFRTFIKTAQTMRGQPSLSFSTASGFQWSFGNALSAIAAAEYGVDGFSIDCTSTGLAANGGYLLTSANNTTSWIQASSEL